MTESSVKSSVKLSVKLQEKWQDRLKTKSKIKSTSKTKSTSASISTIKFSMSSADEKSNEMLNFLHSNISDEMFFSNYSWKRMSFKTLQNVKKSSWLTVLFTSKCQLQVLVMSKFEQEFKFYQETMKSVNHIHWKITMNDQYQSLIENKIWILIKKSDVSSCC